MIQFPKSESYTLPSVENFYNNDSILKEPPKAVYALRRDRVGDDNQMLEWYGSDEFRDRLCDTLRVYDANKNNMVSVDYSYGIYNKNNSVSNVYGSSSSNMMDSTLSGQLIRNAGFNKSPYLVNREDAFRFPAEAAFESTPVYKTYSLDVSAMSQPLLFKFFQQQECGGGKQVVDINKSLKKDKKKNIEVTGQKKIFKNNDPYDNCKDPERYITKKAEAIVNSRFQMQGGSTTAQSDFSDHITQKINGLAQGILSKVEGNNYRTEFDMNMDKKVIEKLAANVLATPGGPLVQKTINVDELKEKTAGYANSIKVDKSKQIQYRPEDLAKKIETDNRPMASAMARNTSMVSRSGTMQPNEVSMKPTLDMGSFTMNVARPSANMQQVGVDSKLLGNKLSIIGTYKK